MSTKFSGIRSRRIGRRNSAAFKVEGQVDEAPQRRPPQALLLVELRAGEHEISALDPYWQANLLDIGNGRQYRKRGPPHWTWPGVACAVEEELAMILPQRDLVLGLGVQRALLKFFKKML